ncbi:OLC1v1007097C1 [Oldenlandia corymbosa var. corymbosa]|uniref:OLC1v1007097C1 n=1 Tax=Oldenlandia corymbosa var. corymbosa TaxID=529605 RepID=A0AAV1DLA2_OLDCO|nr:OLC1v1007097C1 [Oldenlandia corymbosa var. corymbosa]
MSLFQTATRMKYLTRLNVYNHGLTEVPHTLGSLSSLIEFRISRNQLASLPSEIALLRNLKVFKANHNNLTEFPSGLLALTNNLERVELRYNMLTTLRVEIGHLNKLLFLDIDSNQIDHIPPSIGRCVSLRVASFAANLLIDLPFQLEMPTLEYGDFPRCNQLVLSQNQLRALPSWVGALIALCRLNIWYNKLTTLPHEIGSLRFLQVLRADLNSIVMLPPSIGDCRSLRELGLSSNLLTELPDTLANLEE